MRVQRLNPHPVIDDDAIAVDAERRGVNHFALVRRNDGGVDDLGEVEPEMHLTIDFLGLVDVGPLVGKRRFHGAVRERVEDHAAP